MSTIAQEKFNLSLLTTINELKKLMPKLQNSIAEQHALNFKQWNNFSIDNNVIHAQIEYLEWMYGSVYRKQTKHYFLLYNFEVGKDNLTDQHETALTNFVETIYLDQKIKESGVYPRIFEKYDNPFVVNLKKEFKQELINNQPWTGADNASRESLIRKGLLGKFDHGDPNNKWWKGNNVAFADNEGVIDINSSVGNSSHYPPFLIEELLFWRVPPHHEGEFSNFVGHSSETGPDSINNPLSLARAENVSNFIVNKIIEKTNISETLNVAGVGDTEPILVFENELETNENRCVQFTYTLTQDYLHLLTPEKLKARYRARVNAINNDLKSKISYVESYLKNPIGNFEVPGRQRSEMIDSLSLNDRNFTYGMLAIHFAKNYNGDFKVLNSESPLPTNPSGIELSGSFITTPEHKNLSHILPLSEIISRGVYSKSSSAKYKNPVTPLKRINYASKTFKLMINILDRAYAAGISSSSILQAEKFIDYYKEYIKTEQSAYSFLMTPVPLNKLESTIRDNELEYRFNFTNDDPIYANTLSNTLTLKVEVGQYSFVQGIDGIADRLTEEINAGNISKAYWYNKEIRDFHHQMRKIIAKNVVKTVVLESHTKIIGEDFTGFGDFGVTDNFIVLTFNFILMSPGGTSD